MLLNFVNVLPSEEHGDRPRPLPAIKELKNATDITVRKETPAWDFDVCIHPLFFILIFTIKILGWTAYFSCLQ